MFRLIVVVAVGGLRSFNCIDFGRSHFLLRESYVFVSMQWWYFIDFLAIFAEWKCLWDASPLFPSIYRSVASLLLLIVRFLSVDVLPCPLRQSVLGWFSQAKQWYRAFPFSARFIVYLASFQRLACFASKHSLAHSGFSPKMICHSVVVIRFCWIVQFHFWVVSFFSNSWLRCS